MQFKRKTPTIVICMLFTVWFLIVPVILGICLIIRNNKIDKENKKIGNDEISKITTEIDSLNEQKKIAFQEYNDTVNSKEQIIKEFKEEAINKSKEDIEKATFEAQQHLDKINQDIEIRQESLNELNINYVKTQKAIESNTNKINKIKNVAKSMQYAIKAYDYQDYDKLTEALEMVDDEELKPIIEIPLNCLNVKQLKQRYNQEQRNIQETFKRYEGRYNTKANIAIYKLMVIALEAELQNVLFSLKFGKFEESIETIRSITSRYLKIAVNGNQSIAPTMTKFIGEIEFLFIEAVKIEYEYYKQKERIKEEQRAIKEQMRQEAAERKALAEEQKKIEKEESKYSVEISSVEQQIKESKDAEQIRLLEERIKLLQEQMEAVKIKKEKIIELQNGKAGHVYIISNLGSFGENVFKIGMTRRQDPMDRVKELGDASVPFSFDVHSFIFTDDAVGLESTLHKELNDRRVNKINLRKEFFSVSLDEIEELVYKYHPTAEFNRTMLAEEYRQGLIMDSVSSELSEDSFNED